MSFVVEQMLRERPLAYRPTLRWGNLKAHLNFLRLALPSALIRLENGAFENPTGGIWKRRLCIFVWTENIWKRSCQFNLSLFQALVQWGRSKKAERATSGISCERDLGVIRRSPASSTLAESLKQATLILSFPCSRFLQTYPKWTLIAAGLFKFLRWSLDEEHLMRFQNKNAVFLILWRSVDET